MINCREATTLAIAAQDRRLSLSLWRRLQLSLHWLICARCRIYRRQLETMRDAAQALRETPLATPGGGLSEDARKRLRARLRQVCDD
ncbi:MAG: zf-HC2 domain-containing protein [Gammaproteobacteria bacterium]